MTDMQQKKDFSKKEQLEKLEMACNKHSYQEWLTAKTELEKIEMTCCFKSATWCGVKSINNKYQSGSSSLYKVTASYTIVTPGRKI